eukprot:PhF_6_TR28086/c0_g1_i1/m.41505
MTVKCTTISKKTFNLLPLCVLINESILVVHAGIPRKSDVTLAFIEKIDRRRPIPYPEAGQTLDNEVFQDLLWSDPYAGRGKMKSDRGVGYRFGSDLTAAFMATNKLTKIIRSHEVCDRGFEEHHQGKVFTVFSSSDYDGTNSNNAAFAILAPMSNAPQFISYKHSEIDTIMGRSFNNFSHDLLTEMTEETPQQQVLRYIRGQIYDNRGKLLSFFHSIDFDRTGYVWLIDWVAAMRYFICPEAPWLFLFPKLAHTKISEGRIQYVQFVSRFQSNLTKRWTAEWKTRVTRKFASGLASQGEELQMIHFGNVNPDRVLTYPDVEAVIQAFKTGLTESEIMHLYTVFDTDNDGYVTPNEILTTMELHRDKFCQSPKATKDAAGMWQLDVIQEMQHVFMSGKLCLYHVFDHMDQKKTRKLSVEEFQQGMSILNRMLAVPLDTNQMKVIFKYVDVDGDGVISLGDFVNSFTVSD